MRWSRSNRQTATRQTRQRGGVQSANTQSWAEGSNRRSQPPETRAKCQAGCRRTSQLEDFLRINEYRDGAVIDQLDIHVGLELTGFHLQTMPFVERGC